jgi:hypothetical protein
MRLGSCLKSVFALVVFSVFVSHASAAPCIVPPLSQDAVDHFKANPSTLVAPGADARTIEGTVRDLAGTDAALAAELVQLAQGSKPRVQTAIAAGLAQAAVACQTVDQQAALLIQQAVASFQDGEFQNVFAAVAGDLSTAAVAAATDAAVGSVGSVVVTNPTNSRPPTTNFGAGGTPAFFQITAIPATTSPSSSPSTSPTPTTTTTAATPVSRTR